MGNADYTSRQALLSPFVYSQTILLHRKNLNYENILLNEYYF